MRVLIRSPLETLHIPISIKDPEAKYSPFGENAKLKTESEWPMRVFMSSLLYIFHRQIVSSTDPEAKYSPFGENTTL